jgi:hypothetical protein
MMNSLIKKNILLGTFILIVLIGGFYFISNRHSKNVNLHPVTADGKRVNLSPPTLEEKKASTDNKDAIVQKNNQIKAEGDSTAYSQGNLVITDVNSTVAKAYVAGVFEDGGTCTATATQGGQATTASSAGFKNVSYTQCAPLNWPSKLASGAWVVTVTYKSATSQATQTKDITL